MRLAKVNNTQLALFDEIIRIIRATQQQRAE
jgi:hypothetical protein